jgi:hypothetical protein
MADYATLLRDHVTLTCRSVDRIFLQAGRSVHELCYKPVGFLDRSSRLIHEPRLALLPALDDALQFAALARPQAASMLPDQRTSR